MTHRLLVLLTRRRDYVYLTTVFVILFGIGFAWNSYNTDRTQNAETAAIRIAVAQDDAKWCGLLTFLSSTPVPKPADPRANPSRERSYELYVRLITLRHQQGCS